MAERTATVVLKAITTQYQKALKDAADATDRLITKAGGMEAVGGKMSAIGGTLTKSVTMPLALAGGAAIKLSTDFETAFASMVGLAGVPQGEIEGLKDSVMELAGETGRAPKELADALYFAASAGLDAAGAMDAVKVSAKAAAVGMGSTEEVVGLVASAVASYGEENINAAEAVDILTATIREGRAEPSELAGTLGRVLPIASQLGVTFDEVGGTVAYLSNVFGDTNRTVTATQGLLVKLVSPSQQGRKALESMGTSIEDLHAAIDQDGLLGALDLLREKGFAGNQKALRSLFDDIEGYQAALALLNDNSGQLADILGETANAAGAADSAFGTMAETAGFKNAQAFAKLQTALIQIGDALVPIVTEVAEFAGMMLDAFSALPGPVQTAAIALGGILAVTGPMLTIGGKLVSNWHAIGRGFDRAATGAYDAAGGVGKLGKVLGGLAIAAIAWEFHKWAESMSDLNKEASELAGMSAGELEGAFIDILNSGIVNAAGNAERSLDLVTEAITRMAQESPAVVEQMVALADSADGELARALEQAGVSAEDLEAALAAGIGTQVRAQGTQERSAEILDEATGATDEYADATEDAIDPVEELEAALKALSDEFDRLIGVNLSAETAAIRVNDALSELPGTLQENGRSLDIHTEAGRKNREAITGVVGSIEDHVQALIDQGATTNDVSFYLTAYRDRLVEVMRQAGYTEDQIASYIDTLGLTPENIDTLVQLHGVTEAERALSWLARNREAIINVRTNQLDAQAGGARTPGLRRLSGGPIPGPRGAPVPMTGHGGEFMLSADVVDAIKNGRPTAGLGALGGFGPSSSTSVRNGATIYQTNNIYDRPSPRAIGLENRRTMLAHL